MFTNDIIAKLPLYKSLKCRQAIRTLKKIICLFHTFNAVYGVALLAYNIAKYPLHEHTSIL